MLLDSYLSEYEFNEVHTITVQASRDETFRALKELTPSELSPVFRILFDIRSMPARLMGKKDTAFALTEPLLEQIYENDFVLLAENGREYVFGIIGQPWKLTGADPIKLNTPQDFLDFDRPDYARVAANFYLTQNGSEDSFVVRTETRIHIAEPETRKKFAVYWRIIYPGSAWIRRLWLKAIKRRAEQN